jgi:hypothetical protein
MPPIDQGARFFKSRHELIDFDRAGVDHRVVDGSRVLWHIGTLGKVIKPDRITTEIAHGLMQLADGGLFLAFRIEVEHANGAGRGGVGRDGGE